MVVGYQETSFATITLMSNGGADPFSLSSSSVRRTTLIPARREFLEWLVSLHVYQLVA